MTKVDQISCKYALNYLFKFIFVFKINIYKFEVAHMYKYLLALNRINL